MTKTECIDRIKNIKRQIENSHHDISNLPAYKESHDFRLGFDMMYNQIIDIIDNDLKHN